MAQWNTFAMFKFIDLFSGCGGFSLGLSQAGMEGQFAIERDSMAFETFAENFLGKRNVPITKFAWPIWLKKQAWGIDEFLSAHYSKICDLNGTVDVLAGGPPCQGFSFAGKRREEDPRNMLFQRYVQVVEAVRPKAVLLENVPGMKVAHLGSSNDAGKRSRSKESYYDKLKASLELIGYDVHQKIIDAADYGVPQKRRRLIVIGLRRDISEKLEGGAERIFSILEAERISLLGELKISAPVSAWDAISDLRAEHGYKPCTDPYSPSGFVESIYTGPTTRFQVLMHKNCRDDAMDSMRLARHRSDIRERFTEILRTCPKGGLMSKANRELHGLKKHRIYLMSANEPGPTITTLPDDVLHYSEPRILTVRESARIQSFPDWFRFKGKFTTGGAMRKKECPRYTQVGNAVPPLLGRVIGLAIKAALLEAEQSEVDYPSLQTNNLQEQLILMA